jgi:hypothetical protein
VTQLANVGVVVGGTSLDAMLENNNKHVDTVKYVR